MRLRRSIGFLHSRFYLLLRMTHDLEQRTKRFSLALIKQLSSIPRSLATDIISRQLLRAGTSIGANYREANRAVSRADFSNKIGIVQKESSETQYWLELLLESGLDASEMAIGLHREATELLAIFTSIGRKLKEKTDAEAPKGN